MNYIFSILLISATLLISGCSNILMPYKSEFKCQKGAGLGVCNSMSENYEVISSGQLQDQNVTTNNLLTYSTENECLKCLDMSEAIWIKQRTIEKQLEGGNK